MNPSSERVAIVGGGLAGVRTAQALRDSGFSGEITLLSDEDHLPYDRPPLSKNFITGKANAESIRLLTDEKAMQLNLNLELGCRASCIDRLSRTVRTTSGREFSYDHLVVATGASPVRPVIFEGRDNVRYLRTMEDAIAIRNEIKAGARIGIVGAGFVGLELAATAHAAGASVIVFEAAPAPIVRAVGTELGSLVQRWHERKRIEFRCQAKVSALIGAPKVTAVELITGERFTVDALFVGVGQRANVDWLAQSGLEIYQGLVCDAFNRTADPRIFAVGDAACRKINGIYHPTYHWTAAADQATQVAQLICGISVAEPLVDDHYFWSEQHGSRLQFMGQSAPQSRVVMASGSIEEDKFVALCCHDDIVIGVLSLGNPRDFLKFSMPLRRGEPFTLPPEFR